MNIFFLITAVFTLCYVMLIAYFFRGWLRLEEFTAPAKFSPVRLSVIIPARNEEHNLPEILNDLREQNYPASDFEVIVADDFSSDRTAETIRRFPMENLRLVSLEEIPGIHRSETPNKKRAIEEAVHIASGELIVTTDADCRVGTNWLRTIAAFFSSRGVVFIAGPVSYFYDESFLGKFQTLDFLSLVGIAAASIRNGFYNLCNGANLAYTKEAFLAVEGYSGNHHIASGDDMMLMHKIARIQSGRIAFLRNKDAIVYTHTEKDLAAFWRQRMRWTSKSTHYEDRRITAILVFVYLFNLLLLINAVYGLINPFYLRVAMWQFLIKIVADTIFTYSIAKFFRRENLLWLFLPMQLAHIIYVLIVGVAGSFGRRYAWKGRAVHNQNKT